MEERGIRKVKLTSEMKNSFMQYAMSVIVSRALPDVRDGLKPVQRDVLQVHHIRNLPVLSEKLWGNIILMVTLQYMKL